MLSRVPRRTLSSISTNIWSLWLIASVNSAYLNKYHNCNDDSCFILLQLVNLGNLNLHLLEEAGDNHQLPPVKDQQMATQYLLRRFQTTWISVSRLLETTNVLGNITSDNLFFNEAFFLSLQPRNFTPV